MFLSLLTTLAVLGLSPAAPGPAPATPGLSPLTVLIAPTDAAGVPPHIVAFAQEHVYEQLKTEGLRVVRASELSQGLPAAQRKAVLGCNRLEAACRIALGEAAVADVVLVAELVQFLSGYRVGLKAYATRDGELLAEHYVPGVREDQLLDAFTEAINKVVPSVVRSLRPSTQGPPPPTAVVTPTPSVAGVAHPPEEVTARQGAPGWAWVPAAGGVVALGLGTYFVLQARGDYVALTNTKFDNLEQAQAVKQAGASAQTLGRVALGVGALGVVTTGIIYLVSGKARPASSVQPTASVGPTGGMVGLVGVWP